MENESSGTFKLDCSAYRPANPISISQAPRLPSKHSRLSKLRKLAASASHRAIRTIDSISQVGNLEIMPRQQNRPSTRPPPPQESVETTQGEKSFISRASSSQTKINGHHAPIFVNTRPTQTHPPLHQRGSRKSSGQKKESKCGHSWQPMCVS